MRDQIKDARMKYLHTIVVEKFTFYGKISNRKESVSGMPGAVIDIMAKEARDHA